MNSRAVFPTEPGRLVDRPQSKRVDREDLSIVSLFKDHRPSCDAGTPDRRNQFPLWSIGMLRSVVAAVPIVLLFAFQAAAQKGDAPQPPVGPAPRQSQQDPPPDPPDNDDENDNVEKPPKISEMKLPTAADLLRGPRRDWIVLHNDDVIVCEPVRPRPDTLTKMQAKIDAYPNFKGDRNSEALGQWRTKFDDLRYLEIILFGEDDTSPYRLHMRHVAEIRHHEDLMLRRADALMQEKRFRDAFELMYMLERTHSDWPGSEQRRQKLLFLEADNDLQKGRTEPALIALEELFLANPKFQGLKSKLVKTADRLIADALKANDFRRARHFIMRLRRKDPQHAVVSKWVDDLRKRATAEVQAAQDLFGGNRYAAAAVKIERATRIWPPTPGLPTTPELRSTFNRILKRYPRLKVGVLHLPGERSPYFLPLDADLRYQSLTQTVLFELDHSDDSPHYHTRLFEEWEPTDLGRRAVFTLRQNRASWESQPLVTTSEVAASFAARLNPASPGYDERFDSFVESLSVESPFRFEVRFKRVPLRTEALFTFPVGRDANQVGKDRTPGTAASLFDADGTDMASRRFIVHKQTADWIVYRRAVPESARSRQFHVTEILERRYASYRKAMQGLLRGEVSILPHVRTWDTPPLRNDGRFAVVESAFPVTHLLQFNPVSKPMRNRQLRRALAYAIDRPKILRQTVLRDPQAVHGRIVTGPFPSRGLAGNNRRVNGYAYNTFVEPRRPDVPLAISLAMASRNLFAGGQPELTMICVPDSIAEAAAEELIKQWSRAGISVQLLRSDAEETEPASSHWDIIYRTVRMTEPVLDIWPLLTLESRARVQSLAFLPGWLRQELIELENAGDWTQAVGMLHRFHKNLAAQVQLIPLWEVDDFAVFRRNINGFRTPPMGTYQGVERWIVQPWFAEGRP